MVSRRRAGAGPAFANQPVRLPDGLRWDILGLYREVLDGLRAAGGGKAGGVVSVGVDSWAIDYGLLDRTGALLGNPFHYRDGRTDGVAGRVHATLPFEDLYAATGLQFLPFTTVYQLAAAAGSPQLEAARTLLLIPDLLGYWLTGQVGAEQTNASTTGLLDLRRRQWSTQVLATLGLSPDLLPRLLSPGEVLGPVHPEVAEETGLPPTAVVTAVGSHDTASAVVGVPAEGDRFAYLSCGTWSLVGVELDHPVLTVESRQANFTNEGGVDGRVRYLRNVMGLWLLQESLRVWAREGLVTDLAILLAEAADLPAGGPVIDPDDPVFLPPGHGELVRCILDSLAAAYGRAVHDAVRLSGNQVDVVHLVGGGARNPLLCQLAAGACQLPVLAGPVEATALGNVLVQARAHGSIDGDLQALRSLVRATQRLHSYQPSKR